MVGLVLAALIVAPFLDVGRNHPSNAAYAPSAVQTERVTTARLGLLPDIHGVSTDLLLLALLGLGYGAVHLGKTDPETAECGPDTPTDSRSSDRVHSPRSSREASPPWAAGRSTSAPSKHDLPS